MKYKFSRRDALKGMAGLPFLAYFANRFYVNLRENAPIPKVDWAEYGISEFDPEILQAENITAQGEKLRIGVVGYGGRGGAIFRALGFAPEKWAKKYLDQGEPTSLLKNFLDQDDLNIEIKINIHSS